MNMEFSTFPLLCNATYNDIKAVDDRFGGKMPYSGFLHHCTVALNLTLLRLMWTENNDYNIPEELGTSSLLEVMDVPDPIGDYLSHITKTSTAAGNSVSVNIPETAVPRATESPGSFGALTAVNYNVYECYVSPRVTRRRIQAILDRTTDWTPLDEELLPVGFVANQNFLGFGPIDDLNADGRNALTSLDFPADDVNAAVQSRVQFSTELNARCRAAFDYIKDRYKIVPALVNPKTTLSLLAYL